MLEAILLGALQGCTEFLPVSSTGHLVIAHELLGFTTADNALYDIVLQLATAVAALIYFRKDIIEIIASFLRKGDEAGRTQGFAIVVGTIPAVIVGLLFEDGIEAVFRNSSHIAYALLAGSALMFAAERFQATRSEFAPLTAAKGLAIGCFQALALIPGVSRSGSTISGGFFAGLDRARAVRFSFILSIPIIAGAALKKLASADAAVLSSFDASLIVGAAVSFAVGLASIHFLTTYLRTRTFSVFIWYRILLALALIVFL